MLMLSGCSGRCRTLRTAAQLWREGMVLLGQNDPATAEAMQRQALDLVRNIGGFDVLKARIHNNIGVILACSGRHSEANSEFATALGLLHGRVAPDTGLHQIISRNHSTTLARHSPEAIPLDAPTAM